MHARAFNTIRELVYSHSGISLGDNKQELVSARVSKRIRALRLGGIEDYLKYLEANGEQGELINLLDVISTNVTNFFREPAGIDFVIERYREWQAAGQRRFRFWSAACSTGEEPYSLAMALLAASDNANPDLKILATDISVTALERARDGFFAAERVRKVPPKLRQTYLQHERDAGGYRVAPELRRRVIFKWLNLSTPPFPMHGPLDAVLCRNVMIYFDSAVRRRLLTDIHRLLRPGGYLVVGAAESLAGLGLRFQTLQPSVYVKN